MQINLTKKRALVTGASTGIGAAIAESLGECGAHVAVHARTIDKAETTVKNIKAAGGNAIAVEADLMDSTAIKNMCDTTINELNGIDIVVNNAGVHSLAEVVDTDQDTWDKIMQLNLNVPRLITQLTVPVMIKQQTGGRQIYISSLSAMMAEAEGGAYCVSKAGINSLMRCLSVEVGKHGITANAINPAWVDTPMSRKLIEQAQEGDFNLDDVVEQTMSQNILRTVIKPTDIASMVTFLASDHGRCITGQEINICAGTSLLSFEYD